MVDTESNRVRVCRGRSPNWVGWVEIERECVWGGGREGNLWWKEEGQKQAGKRHLHIQLGNQLEKRKGQRCGQRKKSPRKRLGVCVFVP